MVQQNPGLANPDISKIIGEQWRDEPEDRKNQWKLLAEEEKQRHQRQYPDYRYQPRRGNKSGSSQPPRPPLAPGEDPTRCSKCGGRYIATPRTPSTPFVTPTGSKPGLSLYGPPSGHHTLTSSRSDMSRHSRPQPYPHWTGSQSAPSSYDLHQEYERAISPNESKRRRHNPHGSYHNFHALPSPPTPFAQPAHQQHHPASSHSHSRQSPFLNNNATTPSNYPSAPLSTQPAVPQRTSPGPMMPPPPRPTHSMPIAPSGSTPSAPQHQQHHQQQQQQYPPQLHTRHADFDESLRLPPLQTHLTTTTNSPDNNEPHPNTGTGTNAGTLTAAAAVLHPTPATMPSSYYHGPAPATAAAAKRERDAAEQRAHARSIEAMVMSIPFVNKLRVLERISPPLGPVSLPEGMYGGGGGGVNVKRGPVIAVEGPDARLVRAVAVVVERALRAAAAAEGGRAGWEVKCWGGDAQTGAAVSSRQQQQQRGSVGGGEENEVVMSESGTGHTTIAASAANVNTNHFTAYLRTISDWHAKSAEIVDFVSNPSTSSSSSLALPRRDRLSTSSAATVNTTASSSSSSATNSANTDPNKTEPEPDSDSTPRPSKTMPTTQQRHPLPSGSSPKNKNTNINNTNTNNSNTTTSNTTTPTAPSTTPRLPIAFLPSGFSLTLADRFACTVPIADAYAPVDHWQWMATLWRGVVGADLVIYVPWDSSFASLPSSSSSASSSGASPFTAAAKVAGSFVGGGVGGSAGGMGEDGGASGVVMGPWSVEVRNSKLMVVMAPSVAFGSGSGYGERDVEIAVDEKTERRLGFEVVEWVRGGSWLNAGRGLDGGMVMEF